MTPAVTETAKAEQGAGASPPAVAPRQAGFESLEDHDQWVVCLNGKKTHAMIPCGHKCACAACGQLIMAAGKGGSCPICRQDVLMVTGIFDV